MPPSSATRTITPHRLVTCFSTSRDGQASENKSPRRKAAAMVDLSVPSGIPTNLIVGTYEKLLHVLCQRSREHKDHDMIAVTGATGQLGPLVIDALLKSVP